MVADLDRLLDLFVRLAEIPSPSGHERGVADSILGYLRDAGFEPVEDDSGPQTGSDSGNITVRVPGQGDGTPVVVAAHMDTVAVSGPIGTVVEGGVVRSAGDTILGGDDKAACVTLLAVLADLAVAPPPCGLAAVFSTCEEVGLRGAKALDLDPFGARAGFVFDSAGPVGAVITRAPRRRWWPPSSTGGPRTPASLPRRGAARSPRRLWRSPPWSWAGSTSRRRPTSA